MKLYSDISEKAAIGSILMNPAGITKARAAGLISAHFGSERNRAIYSAMLNLAEKGQPIDGPILAAELERTGTIQKAGGRGYIFQILDEIGTSAGLTYHLDQLKELGAKRGILNLLEKARKDLNNGAPPAEVLSDIRSASLQVNGADNSKIKRPKEVLNGVFREIEEAEQNEGRLIGIPSGLNDLDRLTGGWRKGDFTIIAARPGMGKSVLVKDFAEAAGVPVALFSIEMSAAEIVRRQLAGQANVNFERIRTGRLGQSDWGEIIQAADRLSQMPIYYVDLSSLTIDQLTSHAENLKMTEDIGLVVIDYLQLIRTRARLEMREREVSEISRKLKCLAGTLEVPVICACQLNRQCEMRENKRPRLSDLRESGSIEQDADIVGFIYREHQYNSSAPEHKAELIIHKGRNIRTGKINLFFDGEHQRFRNAVRE